jgi:hypothetical protein
MKPMDALQVLAKAAFGDRRNRSTSRIVVTLLVLVLLAAVPVWLLWPDTERAPLLLASFDQVALPDETVSVCARVEALGAETTTNVPRCDLYFGELRSNWGEKVATDRHGMAMIHRSFSPADSQAEITVRYPGDGQRRHGSQARARVFIWPPESSLLMVDAEATLPSGDAAAIWTTNNLDLVPRSGVAACLRAARAKYRIAYLSTSAGRPSRYNKLRAWLERGWAPEQDQFPDGPVLAPACRPPLSEPTEFLKATPTDLKIRFKGTVVGIMADEHSARIFREAGWRTFLLSETRNAPEGVTVVRSWSELSGQLQ